MNFVPVTGNVVPLYGHNTVAPAFLHNSEAELYLMYELAVEDWNSTHDMNDLIDDYDELKTRWYGLTYVNSAFTMTCGAVMHLWELIDRPPGHGVRVVPLRRGELRDLARHADWH